MRAPATADTGGSWEGSACKASYKPFHPSSPDAGQELAGVKDLWTVSSFLLSFSFAGAQVWEQKREMGKAIIKREISLKSICFSHPQFLHAAFSSSSSSLIPFPSTSSVASTRHVFLYLLWTEGRQLLLCLKPLILTENQEQKEACPLLTWVSHYWLDALQLWYKI